ncbi:hypothetical protein FJZ31_32325 [Candidatus Poribacteria bacterium]|nr:hypothetical protein [Candidatus Poribacteria bacterium]
MLITLSIVLYLLYGFTLLFLAIKVLEMLFTSILPTLRNGSRWAREFHKDYASYGGRYAVCKHLKRRPFKIPLNIWIGKRSHWVANYICRYCVLMPLASLLLFVIANKTPFLLTDIKVGAVVIFVALAIGVLHELIDRIAMGVASNIQTSAFREVANIDYNTVSYATSDVVQRCVVTLISHLFDIWLGFTAIYYFFITWWKESFKGLKTIFDCMYFSLVAMTTTGFGDIYPVVSQAKLLVASEIVMSWSLVVIAIFHYSATMSVDLTK